MKKYYYYFIFIAFLFSCSEKVVETNFLKKKLPAKEKIKWILSCENASVLNLNDQAIETLNSFYKARNYKALWINDSTFTETGEQVFKLIQKPIVFGLPNSRNQYEINDSTHLIMKEIYCSISLLTYTQDLRFGILDSAYKLKPITYPNIGSYNLLEKIQSSDIKEIGKEIISWGPKDTVYEKLAINLFDFALNLNFVDENLKVPTFKKDSLKSLNLAKKSLVQKGYISDIQTNKQNKVQDSSIFINALMKFQTDNGLKADGLIGQTTVEALNETQLEKCQRAAVVLEKLRWRNVREIRHIEVNIPEYTLRFFADDTLKSVNRIIVGKYDTQTPEFNSQLRTIIAYPFWSVPFSITSKEILPDAKRNPNYFARNQMKVYKKDQEIDPLTVNWKGIRENTFPYKVVQQPGKHNSLGIIKFDFNNKYGVYFHDTPQKGLFNTVIRSYSHGCMRCENPIDLAKTILLKDENKIIPDSLDSILTRVVNRPIYLKKKIPLYVEYRSVVVKNEQLIFLRDIYYRDKKIAKKMFA